MKRTKLCMVKLEVMVWGTLNAKTRGPRLAWRIAVGSERTDWQNSCSEVKALILRKV